MSTLGIIIVIVLVVALFGGFAGDRVGVPYGYGLGHSGIGIVGAIFVGILILWAMGYLR